MAKIILGICGKLLVVAAILIAVIALLSGDGAMVGMAAVMAALGFGLSSRLMVAYWVTTFAAVAVGIYSVVDAKAFAVEAIVAFAVAAVAALALNENRIFAALSRSRGGDDGVDETYINRRPSAQPYGQSQYQPQQYQQYQPQQYQRPQYQQYQQQQPQPYRLPPVPTYAELKAAEARAKATETTR